MQGPSKQGRSSPTDLYRVAERTITSLCRLQSGERSEVNNKLGRTQDLKLGASALRLSDQSSMITASGCAARQPMKAVECVAESLILDGDLAQRHILRVQILVFEV